MAKRKTGITTEKRITKKETIIEKKTTRIGIIKKEITTKTDLTHQRKKNTDLGSIAAMDIETVPLEKRGGNVSRLVDI